MCKNCDDFALQIAFRSTISALCDKIHPLDCETQPLGSFLVVTAILAEQALAKIYHNFLDLNGEKMWRQPGSGITAERIIVH